MRLTKVTVGPLATADADGVSVSQSAPGAQGLVISGALSAGYDADLIAAAQTAAGAEDLTLTAAAANLGGRIVVITSAADDSGVVFTVKGLDRNGAYLSEALTGTNAGLTATTQEFIKVTAVSTDGATAGDVTVGVNGTVTMDTPRRVLITTADDETGVVFTIAGTDWNGNPITEAVTGVNNSTVQTAYDFSTVTAITVDGATTAAVQVGTNGVGSSRPIFLDGYALAPTALQVDVSGTVNYTVQQTLDNINDVGFVNVDWVNYPDSALASATATAQGNFGYVPSATRVLLNSGTGTVTYTVLQASGTVM